MTEPLQAPKTPWVVAVVDDDYRVLESLENLLESSGYRVLLYATAEEFLGSPQRASVDCLISDIGLPGMNGLELIRALRAQSQCLPIILITARTEEHFERDARELDILGYFVKPFDAGQLLAALQEILQQRPSQ